MAKKTAEEYVGSHPVWSDELKTLRQLLLKSELEETVKWGMPVYTLDGKNVVGIAGFKKHYGLWFYQGVFLSDSKNLLVNAQEGKTKAMRQMKFFLGDKLNKKLITQYINEATENQKKGLTVKPESVKLTMPTELKKALDKDGMVKKSFLALTPGKQKEYMGYILEAKMEKTKLSRIQKIIPLIQSGKGLHDKYKK